jgi:hypothetical protein
MISLCSAHIHVGISFSTSLASRIERKQKLLTHASRLNIMHRNLDTQLWPTSKSRVRAAEVAWVRGMFKVRARLPAHTCYRNVSKAEQKHIKLYIQRGTRITRKAYVLAGWKRAS